jgi:cyclopropane fatty-acyl-phospholipid synthase-like methyltransferase
MGAMVEAARGTALAVHSIRDIGPDYAVTLRAWKKAWEEHRKEVRSTVCMLSFIFVLVYV